MKNRKNNKFKLLRFSKNFTLFGFTTLLFVIPVSSFIENGKLNDYDNSYVSNESKDSNVTSDVDYGVGEWINVYDVFGYETSNVSEYDYANLVNKPGELDVYGSSGGAKLKPVYSVGNYMMSFVFNNNFSDPMFGEIVYGVNFDYLYSDELFFPYENGVGAYKTNNTDHVVGYNLSTFNSLNINPTYNVYNEWKPVYTFWLPDYIEYVSDVSISFEIYDQYYDYENYYNKYLFDSQDIIYLDGFYHDYNDIYIYLENMTHSTFIPQQFLIVPRYYDLDDDNIYTENDEIYAIDLMTNWDSNRFYGQNNTTKKNELYDFDILLTQTIKIKFDQIIFKTPEIKVPQIFTNATSANIRFSGDIYNRSFDDFKLKIFETNTKNLVSDEDIINNGDGSFEINNLKPNTSYTVEIYYHQNPMDYDVNNDGQEDFLKYVGDDGQEDYSFTTLSQDINPVIDVKFDLENLSYEDGIVTIWFESWFIDIVQRNHWYNEKNIELWYSINGVVNEFTRYRVNTFPDVNTINYYITDIKQENLYIQPDTSYYIDFGVTFFDLFSFTFVNDFFFHTNYKPIEYNESNSYTIYNTNSPYSIAFKINLEEKISRKTGKFIDLSSSESKSSLINELFFSIKKINDYNYLIKFNNLISQKQQSFAFQFDVYLNRYYNDFTTLKSFQFNLMKSKSYLPKLNYYKIVTSSSDEYFYLYLDFDSLDKASFENVKIKSNDKIYSVKENSKFSIEEINNSESSVTYKIYYSILDDNQNFELFIPNSKTIDNDPLYSFFSPIFIDLKAEENINDVNYYYDEDSCITIFEIETNVISYSNPYDFYIKYYDIFKNNESKVLYFNEKDANTRLTLNYDNTKDGYYTMECYLFKKIPSGKSFQPYEYGFGDDFSKQIDFEIIFDTKYIGGIIDKMNSKIEYVGRDFVYISFTLDVKNNFSPNQLIVIDGYNNLYKVGDGLIYKEKIDMTYYYVIENLDMSKDYGTMYGAIPNDLEHGSYVYENNYVNLGILSSTIAPPPIENSNNDFYFIITILTIFLIIIIILILFSLYYWRRIKLKFEGEYNLRLWMHSMLSEEEVKIIFEDDFENLKKDQINYFEEITTKMIEFEDKDENF